MGELKLVPWTHPNYGDCIAMIKKVRGAYSKENPTNETFLVGYGTMSKMTLRLVVIRDRQQIENHKVANFPNGLLTCE